MMLHSATNRLPVIACSFCVLAAASPGGRLFGQHSKLRGATLPSITRRSPPPDACHPRAFELSGRCGLKVQSCGEVGPNRLEERSSQSPTTYGILLAEVSRMNLTVTDVKVFVPAKEFAPSAPLLRGAGLDAHHADRRQQLGRAGAGEAAVSICRTTTTRRGPTTSCLTSPGGDARAWHDHAKAVIDTGNYGPARLWEPKEESYGSLVTYVWDPSGVLLHFAQPLG